MVEHPHAISTLSTIFRTTIVEGTGKDVAATMAKTHEDIQNKLEENNPKYKKAADVHRRVKVFKEDDLVWVYMNN